MTIGTLHLRVRRLPTICHPAHSKHRLTSAIIQLRMLISCLYLDQHDRLGRLPSRRRSANCGQSLTFDWRRLVAAWAATGSSQSATLELSSSLPFHGRFGVWPAGGVVNLSWRPQGPPLYFCSLGKVLQRPQAPYYRLRHVRSNSEDCKPIRGTRAIDRFY
jgi:hypothetical protein